MAGDGNGHYDRKLLEDMRDDLGSYRSEVNHGLNSVAKELSDVASELRGVGSSIHEASSSTNLLCQKLDIFLEANSDKVSTKTMLVVVLIAVLGFSGANIITKVVDGYFHKTSAAIGAP